MNINEFLENRTVEFDIPNTSIIEEGWKYWKWDIEITYQGRTIEIDFFGGELASCPDLIQVLECLHSDYWSVENTTGMLGFAEEFGYLEEEDVTKDGVETYMGILENNEKLKLLWGDEFEEFINCDLA